jgi:hypothetical protein
MSFHFNPKLVTDGLIWAMDIANPTSFTPPNGGSSNSINDLTIYNNNSRLISSSGRPYTYSSNDLGSIDFYNDQISSTTLGSYAQLNSVIDTGNNFSVFFWVKPYSGSFADIGTGRNTIMTNAYKYAITPSRKCGWFFLTFIAFPQPNPTTFNGFSFAIGRDTSVLSVGSNSIVPNTWNYLGFTVANSGGTMRAYRNGVQVASTTANSTAMNYTGNTTASLARRWDSSADLPDRFSGSLAAGHIYNRVLTPQEIGQNYNAYKARFGLI